VTEHTRPAIAILLATCNGARFVSEQIRSLASNSTHFTVHWLDDHSSDGTREIVRTVAAKAEIDVVEWHQNRSLGVPTTFFQLLECVEADIYLFCDQDDIWEPGKIDATANGLTPYLGSPALFFSDPLLFRSGSPEHCFRALDVLGESAEAAMEDSRVFLSSVGFGHTQGFTRPLRDIFLKHRDIARRHAYMHDAWLNVIGAASGVRILANAPTTRFRRHEHSASRSMVSWKGKGKGYWSLNWDQMQRARRGLALQARGFIAAAPTLPQGPRLDRILDIARIVAGIDERHSPSTIIRLMRRRITWNNRRLALRLVTACLCSDARN
jgi:glycosyltransferase involved in cell wall biosynthesis